MTLQPNYVRGGEYFWAPRAMLACLRISRSKWMLKALQCGMVPLYVKLPSGARKADFIRVSLTTVRTKREIDAMVRRFKQKAKT